MTLGNQEISKKKQQCTHFNHSLNIEIQFFNTDYKNNLPHVLQLIKSNEEKIKFNIYWQQLIYPDIYKQFHLHAGQVNR